MIIEEKKWDSEFFDLKIGQVFINNSDDFDFTTFQKAAQSYDLVYIFSKDDIPNLIKVDKKVVFLKQIIKNTTEPFEEVVSYSEDKHSLNELEALALASGGYSRFNLDKNFKNGEYQKLYKEWIIKSVNKKLALDVLVFCEENHLLGFTTLAKKNDSRADIGLVAVDEKCRGKGIAKKLIKSTIAKADRLGFKEIQVVTQFENNPAMNLYKSSGFTIEKRTNIYHYWNL